MRYALRYDGLDQLFDAIRRRGFRCITWCPAGIDITEEVAAIAAGS